MAKATTHTAEIIPDGDCFLVVCPHGCELGTSAHTADMEAAQQRVRLHGMATSLVVAMTTREI